WAEVDGARQELGGRSVRMEGTLALDVAPVDAMDGPHARPQDTLAPRDAGDLSGSGDLWLDGVAVAPALEAQAPAAAAALGGLVLLLILGLAVKTGALASLYTRVTRARVLENDSRRALFALIRERPGLHVSELARATGIGRVVLQHHLRMLEAHGLVVPRTRGRLVAYFSPGGVPGEQELAAKVALKDPTRRRVLDATASSPTTSRASRRWASCGATAAGRSASTRSRPPRKRPRLDPRPFADAPRSAAVRAPWPPGFVRIPDEDWTRAPLDALAVKYDAVEKHGWYANLDPTVEEIVAFARPGHVLVDYSGGTGILIERLL